MTGVTYGSVATVLALIASITNGQSPVPSTSITNGQSPVPSTSITNGQSPVPSTTYSSTSRRPRDYIPLTSEEIQVILEVHNKARKMELHGDIGNLTWNSILAAIAQRWANACNFTHQPPEIRKWGENLAAIINTKSTSDHLTAMIKQWVEEKKHNSRGTFEECCSFQSSLCCHYTQMVWASTTSVGCGYNVCSKLTYGTGSLTNIAFLACYYNPSGNIPKITYDWRPYVPKVAGQRTTSRKPSS